jgi:hypothetical protein
VGDLEERYCIGNVARGVPHSWERSNAVRKALAASIPCLRAGWAYSTTIAFRQCAGTTSSLGHARIPKEEI